MIPGFCPLGGITNPPHQGGCCSLHWWQQSFRLVDRMAGCQVLLAWQDLCLRSQAVPLSGWLAGQSLAMEGRRRKGLR